MNGYWLCDNGQDRRGVTFPTNCSSLLKNARIAVMALSRHVWGVATLMCKTTMTLRLGSLVTFSINAFATLGRRLAEEQPNHFDPKY